MGSKIQPRFNKRKTKHAVNLFIAKSRVKNEKALQGFLNHENIKLNEDGTLSGLSEQIETIKKDNPYLFIDSSQPKDINLGDDHSSPQGKEITNLADAISDYYGK